MIATKSAALFLGLSFGATLFAAEPAIRTLDIRGLRIHGTTTVTIDGDDLGKAPRLLLPFDAKQTLKPGATDNKATFDVALGPDVVPGYHHLRLVSEGGVSLPVVIAVDRMPQLAITPAIQELPVALHGSVAGSAVVETKFQGKAKQRIMIEVEAHRLGGKLRPVVHLISPKKLQIGWAWGVPSLYGDSRLEATLPEDGTYTVTLHDAEYAAPAPSFFRLRIGEWSYVDQVFPPVVNRANYIPVELVSNAPARIDTTVNTKKSLGETPVAWPKAGLWSGPRPFVHVSSRGEVLKRSAKDTEDLPEGRIAVSGKLITAYDEHRYRIAVKPAKRIKFEVIAERLGSPIDAALVVRNGKGDLLVRGEDSPGTLDPQLEYTVPDKVTSIIVGVVDAQGRGGPRGIYRLVVDPQSAELNQDEFKLTTPAQRITLPIGGRAVFPVVADRRGGYMGTIDIASALALPAGVRIAGNVIPDSADGSLVTLERSDAVFDAFVTTFRGRNANGTESPALVKGHPLEKLQPWLANEIAIAPSTNNATEFTIDWRDLPEKTVLLPATRLLLPIKLTRPASKTTVRLTLLTSQNTPLANNQPDPNKSLRQDKIAELAANVNTGDVTVLVPAELPSPVYDVTVQAELLDAGKKPIATAYAPVRRMQVILPITVNLDGPSRIETTFDVKKGAVVKLVGKIERREGLKADVVLALTGLPAGAKAEAVTVKADATVFAVSITLPPTIAPGEFTGVKLSGSYLPDAKQANVRVRSRDVDVTLILKSRLP
jgi:hypothetical protein